MRQGRRGKRKASLEKYSRQCGSQRRKNNFLNNPQAQTWGKKKKKIEKSEQNKESVDILDA